jgi:hypothetical protein
VHWPLLLVLWLLLLLLTLMLSSSSLSDCLMLRWLGRGRQHYAGVAASSWSQAAGNVVGPRLLLRLGVIRGP